MSLDPAWEEVVGSLIEADETTLEEVVSTASAEEVEELAPGVEIVGTV